MSDKHPTHHGFECADWESEISHVLLGQADPDLSKACRAHVLACGDCRAAWEATEQVLRLVRKDSVRAPSSGFRASLAARIEGERREEDARLAESAGLAGRIAAGAAYVRFRVVESTSLKVVLAAAAAHLFALGAWWYVDRAEPATPQISEIADAGPASPSEDPIRDPDPATPVPVTPDPASPTEVVAAAPSVSSDDEPDPADYIAVPLDPAPEVAVVDPPEFSPGFEEALEEALSRENMFARARHQMRLRLSAGGNGLASRQRTDADKAALRGMRFLIENQEDDGSWDPTAFGGEQYARVGVTGLCLAALSVDAGIPNDLQRTALDRGHAYLRGVLDRSTMTFGGVVRGLADANDVTLFNHSLATLALSEKYVLDGRSGRAERPGEEPVEAILNEALVRLDDLGQQRFNRELDEEDTTTAPWVALALETARASGLRAEAVNLARAADSARQFVANQLPERPADADLWAVVTISGIDPLFDRELSAGVWQPPLTRMLPHLMTPALREPTKIFFASLDFHQRGDVDWKEWSGKVEEVLLKGQHEDGAWESEFVWDRVQSAGGDLYATALSVMTLSVRYRHAL